MRGQHRILNRREKLKGKIKFTTKPNIKKSKSK